jgi:hypothetical protein
MTGSAKIISIYIGRISIKSIRNPVGSCGADRSGSEHAHVNGDNTDTKKSNNNEQKSVNIIIVTSIIIAGRNPLPVAITSVDASTVN